MATAIRNSTEPAIGQRVSAPLRLALLLSSLATAAAWAAVPAQAQPSSDAATHFARGVADMRDENFDSALARFRLAESLHPHGANQFNIAVCLEELGHLLEAQRTYRDALETGELDEERAREASLRVEALDGRLATLEIVREEDSARSEPATIDGERCSLPCRLRVDPGEHEIAATGFHRNVVVPEGGEVRVAIPAPSAPDAASDREFAPSAAVRRRQSQAGWWIAGGALTGLGVAGAIGFGLHTQALKDEFNTMPSLELQEDGVRARRWTNASIATAGIGIGLLLVGWVVRATTRTREVAVDTQGVRLSF